VTWSSQIFT